MRRLVFLTALALVGAAPPLFGDAMDNAAGWPAGGSDGVAASSKAVPGVATWQIDMSARVRAQPSGAAKDQLLPHVKNVVLVGAGKGGVGKSTVALNLACALARHGASVGLLDADFYGPSVPVMTSNAVTAKA